MANVIGFATVKGHRYPGVAHLKNKRKKKSGLTPRLRTFDLFPTPFSLSLSLFLFFLLSSRNQTKISCGKRVGEAGRERKEKRVIGKRDRAVCRFRRGERIHEARNYRGKAQV